MSDTSEQIDIQAPGGFKLGFKGEHLMPVVLLFLLGGASVYAVYAHDQKGDARAAEAAKALAEVKEAVRSSEETQKAMIYVMTLPDHERNKLNLMKPKSLSDMQR